MATWIDTLEEPGSRKFGDGPDGLTADRTFTIKFADRASEFDARFAPGVPQYGFVHPHQGFIRALEFDGRTTGAANTLWKIDVHYRNPDFADTPSLLNGPTQYRWDTISTPEEIDRDIYNFPLENTSGEPYDPPLQRDFADLRLSISRTEVNWTAAIASAYINKVNSDVFFGFAPGLARMIGISADLISFQSDSYWVVNYTVQFRRDGWLARVMNTGYRGYKTAGSSDLVELTDPLSQKVTKPFPLKEDSTIATTPSETWFRFWELYESIAFGPLAL